MDKLPPIEKIYEAYSAIADSRVCMTDGAKALIRSSGGDKEYTVTWEGNTYFSDDSASYWQGYAGYPVIAVLMLRGRLPLNRKIAACFTGVNWSTLNKKYKRNYARAAAEALADIEAGGGDIATINTEVREVFEELGNLDILVKRGSRGR